LRLSAEGSVVGLFVLDRGEYPQGAVQTSVVVPIDPPGGGVLDVGDGLVGAVVEGVVMIASVLNSPMIDSVRALS
jgi:hypothetical protein